MFSLLGSHVLNASRAELWYSKEDNKRFLSVIKKMVNYDHERQQYEIQLYINWWSLVTPFYFIFFLPGCKASARQLEAHHQTSHWSPFCKFDNILWILFSQMRDTLCITLKQNVQNYIFWYKIISIHKWWDSSTLVILKVKFILIRYLGDKRDSCW